jgi:hypothetical protein
VAKRRSANKTSILSSLKSLYRHPRKETPLIVSGCEDQHHQSHHWLLTYHTSPRLHYRTCKSWTLLNLWAGTSLWIKLVTVRATCTKKLKFSWNSISIRRVNLLRWRVSKLTQSINCVWCFQIGRWILLWLITQRILFLKILVSSALNRTFTGA